MEYEHVAEIGKGKTPYVWMGHTVNAEHIDGMRVYGDGMTHVLSATNVPCPRQTQSPTLVLPPALVSDQGGQSTHTFDIVLAENTPATHEL